VAYQYPPSSTPVLDLVLTGGATAGAAALTAAGFTLVRGSGESFDNSFGYNGNGTGGRSYQTSSPSWAATMNAATEFTILVQLRRVDIAKWVLSNTSIATDSEGVPPAAQGMFIGFDGNSTPSVYGQYLAGAAGAGSGLTNSQYLFKASDAVTKTITTTLCSHFSNLYDDPDGFVELGFTVTPATASSTGTYTLLIDGYPVCSDTVAAGTTWTNSFVRGTLACQFGASSFWSGWIRRVRLYNKAVRWNYNLFPKIGVLGDSFAQRGTGRANTATAAVTSITRATTTYTVTTTAPHGRSTNDWVTISGATSSGTNGYNGVFQITVTGASTFTYTSTNTGDASAGGTILVAYETTAAIAAVQNDLDDTVLLNSGANRHFTGTAMPNEWVFCMERWAVRAGLPPFRVYNAGKSGTAFSVNPLPPPYLTALAAWNPEIVIWNFSVNDVDGTLYNPQTQITAAKAMIDSFIAQSPKTRRILLCQVWPAKSPLGGWSSNHDLQIRQQAAAQAQAGLDGYSNGIVKFIPAYDLLGGVNYDTRFNVGLYPNIQGGVANSDIHPGGFGMLKMAEVIWPYLRREIGPY